MKVEVAVPNNPNGFCGRKATFEEAVYHSELRRCVKVEVADNPYGFCGRKATWWSYVLCINFTRMPGESYRRRLWSLVFVVVFV